MNKKGLLSISIIFIIAGLVFLSMVDNSEATSGSPYDHGRDLQEDQMLKATVRIMIESWTVRPDEKGYEIDTTVGHGTVMAGRYLVTHNHFGVPLSILNRQGDAGSYGVVYLYSSHGELVYKGPLADFLLAGEDVETLVFAHKDAGFFEDLGFASAVFTTWQQAGLEPGMEVAQVDWDGVAAHADWVKVREIILDDGAPRLVLDDGVLLGASGGGIFYQGMHVANNWRLEEKLDKTGTVVEAVTAVALNSPRVLQFQ